MSNRGGKQHRSTGYTLVEVAIATFIVGVMLVTAMNTLGSATRSQIGNRQHNQALLLASGMMSEILAQSYSDPESGTGINIDAGEETSTRADFDDVDDYHNWSSTPPESADGVPLASGDAMTRTVTVEYVDPDNLASTIGSDGGVKRITITVTANDADLTSLSTIVTSAR